MSFTSINSNKDLLHIQLTKKMIVAFICTGLSVVGLFATSKETAETTTSIQTTTSISTTTLVAIEEIKKGVEEFSAVDVRIISGKSKKEHTYCFLLADTEEKQAKGMMFRENFEGYDGMVFVFSQEMNNPFYMANVIMPISLAWIDRRGRYINDTEMLPCKKEASLCKKYKPQQSYRVAIEVPKGSLGKLGIERGSVIEVQKQATTRGCKK